MLTTSNVCLFVCLFIEQELNTSYKVKVNKTKLGIYNRHPKEVEEQK